MHSEISEVLEDFRKNIPINEIYYEDKKPCGIPVEFADLLIRVFDTCGKYGIDLENALKIKMEYNKTRPYKHGKVC
jgi:NTP pyrophosphatase (non-canonical NTP hydrolase)